MELIASPATTLLNGSKESSDFLTDPLFDIEILRGEKLKGLPFITDPLKEEESCETTTEVKPFSFCNPSPSTLISSFFDLSQKQQQQLPLNENLENNSVFGRDETKFQVRKSITFSSLPQSSLSSGANIYISGRSIPIQMLSTIERVGVIPYMKLLATSSLQSKKAFSAEEEKIGSVSKYWFAFGIDAVHGELTDCGGKRTSALEPIERTAVRELYEESMTLFDYRKRECDILNSPVVTNGKTCIFFLRIHPPFSKSGFPFDLPKLFVSRRRQLLSGKCDVEKKYDHHNHQQILQGEGNGGNKTIAFSKETPRASLSQNKHGIVLKTPRGGEQLKSYSDYLNGKHHSSTEEREDIFEIKIQKTEDMGEEVESTGNDTNASLYSVANAEDDTHDSSLLFRAKTTTSEISSSRRPQRQRRRPVFFENSLMYWIPFEDVKNLTRHKASLKGGVFTKGYHMSPVPMSTISLSAICGREDPTINEISKLISTARDNFESIKDISSSATSSSSLMSSPPVAPLTIGIGSTATFSSKKKLSLSLSQNIIASSKDESEIPFNHPFLYENIRKILFDQFENIKEYL